MADEQMQKMRLAEDSKSEDLHRDYLKFQNLYNRTNLYNLCIVERGHYKRPCMRPPSPELRNLRPVTQRAAADVAVEKLEITRERFGPDKPRVAQLYAIEIGLDGTRCVPGLAITFCQSWSLCNCCSTTCCPAQAPELRESSTWDAGKLCITVAEMTIQPAAMCVFVVGHLGIFTNTAPRAPTLAGPQPAQPSNGRISGGQGE